MSLAERLNDLWFSKSVIISITPERSLTLTKNVRPIPHTRDYRIAHTADDLRLADDKIYPQRHWSWTWFAQLKAGVFDLINVPHRLLYWCSTTITYVVNIRTANNYFMVIIIVNSLFKTPYWVHKLKSCNVTV